jgi:hypothetical protein
MKMPLFVFVVALALSGADQPLPPCAPGGGADPRCPHVFFK